MFTEGGVYGAYVVLAGRDIEIKEIESEETSEECETQFGGAPYYRYDYYCCDNDKPMQLCLTAEDALSESSSDCQPPQLCQSPSIRMDNGAEWTEAARLELASLNDITTLELRMPMVD
eukprot:2876254-Rhodomonas_salina.1